MGKISEALLVLISKVEHPSMISQFRLISLCNDVYELVTKILVNMLKPLFGVMVSPNQGSFVSGHQITGNVIICQEVIHTLRMKKGKKGWIVMKTDLEKAYDRPEWGFISDTLNELGLPKKMVDIITECIGSSQFRLLWKEESTEAVSPGRGFQQGDPIPLYIFVLCMECLAHIIQMEVEGGRWKPLKALRGGPQISYLFFADDMLFFSKASKDKVDVILLCLAKFERASGQKVSLEVKSIFLAQYKGGCC